MERRQTRLLRSRPSLLVVDSSHKLPITIFARITKDLAGVSGATASAVVHFQGGDQTLDQHPVSDKGGYVSFTLALQGRQPVKIPATVVVTFGFPGVTLNCTPAFFTPM